LISKGFIKSSIIYTLAGALPMASALILLPFYIKQLPKEVYGALSIYLAFSLLVQILVTFSFDSSIYIHFHEFKNDRKKLSTFISSAFIFMLLIGLGVMVAFMGLGDLIFSLVLPDQNISFYPYGVASVGAGVFQALFKVHSSLLQSREKPETFFWSNVLSFSMIASFTIIGLKLFPHSLMGPIVGRLLASVVAGAWATMRIFSAFGFRYDFSWLKSSFSFNAYTFIYQILQWIINYFDRIVMLVVLTLADIGIYVFAAQCLVVLELIMNSLHSSFYPKVVSAIMAQDHKHSSPNVTRYYHGLIGIMMLGICGAILFLPWAIETFDHRNVYKESISYLPYLAGIYFFRTMRLFFTSPYSILKYTKPLPIIYLVVASLKIIIMLVLMTRFGIYGVIIASLTSALIEIVLLHRNIRTKFQFRFNVFKIVVAPMILFFLIIFLEPTLGKNHPFSIHLFYLLSCGGLLWWAYRHEIRLINPFTSR
jgi:O-antigen/teichoic acid export membrane protein